MKRFAFIVMAALLVTGLSADLFAQGGRPVNTSGSDAQPLSVNISGGTSLHYVSQDRAVATSAPGGVPANRTDNWWHGLVTLNLDMEFANNVTSRVQLQTLKTGAGYARWGAGNPSFDIEEAYIRTQDWLAQNLTLTIGKQGYARELEAGEGSMFMDLANSGPLGTGTLIDTAGGAGHTGTNDPVGIVGTINSADKNWSLDIVWLTVVEGGSGTNSDGQVYGLGFTYNFPQGQKLNVDVFNLREGGNPLAGDDTDIIDIGVGLWWGSVVNNLDAYAEVHFQNGDVENAAGLDVNDAGGQAFRVGLRYHFQSQSNAWVELAYWSVSGDETGATGTGSEIETFLSYQNVNDFAIVESNLYGLDVASNYTAIKLKAGMDTTWNVSKTGAMKDNLHITAKLGVFEVENDVDVFDTDGPGPGAADGQDIGTEFDIEFVWDQSASLSFDLTLGYLFGSEMLESATAAATFTAGPPAGDDSEDSGMVFVLGANIKH